MARKGRELEKLIERIEKAINPDDVEITSPDYFIDLETKERREVDVSIRLKKLPHPLVVVLECRDRKEKEDVRWIEQLIKKRASIGVDKIIAVSTKAFTNGAKKKAKLHRIPLLELKKLPPNAEKLILSPTFVLTKLNSEIHYVRIDLVSDNQKTTFPKNFLKNTKNMLLEPILLDSQGKVCTTLADVFCSKVPHSAWENVIVGVKQRRKIQLNFKNPLERYYLKTNEGLAAIVSIFFIVDLFKTTQEETFNDRVLVDVDTGGTVAHHSEVTLPIKNHKHKLTFTKNSLGSISALMFKEDEI